MAHEHRQGRSGVVEIGSTVLFDDGSKAGTISKVIVDPNNDIMTDIVVKKGMLLSEERIVPLGCIDFNESGELFLDMDKDGFKELGLFDDTQFRSPSPDYTGPPGFDASANGVRNLQFEAIVAGGSNAGLGGPNAKVGGFPQEASSRSANPMSRPALGQGDPVLDVDGEQVGEIDELELDPEDGHPVRLVVREGMIFRKSWEVPADYIAQLSNKGVVLDVRKSELEREDAETFV